jgi:amino acid transporter
MAGATAITVFVIAVAYNQVIELFPTGGGGYRVATSLIGPYVGLISGAALIVDYMLTIAISVASGVDALFSLLPLQAHAFKLVSEIGIVLLLMGLNLRGMQESIKLLLPIFLGFFVVHAFLIPYVLFHAEQLPGLIPDSLNETAQFARETGWVFVVSLFLRAYSLCGGTYTGIEAVSNNVQSLAEPRVSTGKWTMFYMALSLSFTAGGIISALSVVERTTDRGTDPQRSNVSVHHRKLRLAKSHVRKQRALARSCIGGWPIVCRGQYRLSRRTGGARQHGGGFLGPAPVSLPFDTPRYPARNPADGPLRLGDSGANPR